MGSLVASPLVSLLVRVFTLIMLMASLIVLATDNIKYAVSDDYLGNDVAQITFNNYYAYRYMLSVMIIGLVWILIQSALAFFHVSSGNPFGGVALAHVEFYSDKVISYLLATGAAAGFGLSVDAKRNAGNNSLYDDFYNRGAAAAALLFIGFLLSAISSVISSLNLPKTVNINENDAI